MVLQEYSRDCDTGGMQKSAAGDRRRAAGGMCGHDEALLCGMEEPMKKAL